MIIATSGRIGSGKDEFANRILELDPSFKVKKFAGKLKQITALLIGCSVQDLESQEFKSSPLSKDWVKWHVTDLEDATGNLLDPSTGLPNNNSQHQYGLDMEWLTPRTILQLLGTECGRQIIHPEIWINSLFADYKPGDNWIITDCRFPNEARAVKDRGGILVRINRGTPTAGAHISETALDYYSGFDVTIDNNGTLEDLHRSAAEVFYQYCSKIIA